MEVPFRSAKSLENGGRRMNVCMTDKNSPNNITNNGAWEYLCTEKKKKKTWNTEVAVTI